VRFTAALGALADIRRRLCIRSTAQLAFGPSQRRTRPSVGAPPHPARLWRQPCARNLTIVAELPATFSSRHTLSPSTTGALCRVPEAITATTRQPWFEIVDRADATTTRRALQPRPLTHDTALGPNERYSHGATGH